MTNQIGFVVDEINFTNLHREKQDFERVIDVPSRPLALIRRPAFVIRAVDAVFHVLERSSVATRARASHARRHAANGFIQTQYNFFFPFEIITVHVQVIYVVGEQRADFLRRRPLKVLILDCESERFGQRLWPFRLLARGQPRGSFRRGFRHQRG